VRCWIKKNSLKIQVFSTEILARDYVAVQ